MKTQDSICSREGLSTRRAGIRPKAFGINYFDSRAWLGCALPRGAARAHVLQSVPDRPKDLSS
jgi:hypothetical protein